MNRRHAILALVLLSFLVTGCLEEPPASITQAPGPVSGQVTGSGLVKLPASLTVPSPTAAPSAAPTTAASATPTATATPKATTAPKGKAATATACGTVSSNLVLAGDVVMPSSEDVCLVVAKDNVIIDCGGRVLSPALAGTGTGVLVNGYKNVVVKNCVLQRFAVGIKLSNAEGALATGNTASDFSAGTGVLALASKAANVSGNTITVNEGSTPTAVGINVTDSASVEISGNAIEGGLTGVFADRTTDIVVNGNSVRKAVSGLLVFHSDNAKITANTIKQSSFASFALPASGISASGSATTIQRNVVEGQKNAIECDGVNSVIEDNKALSSERGIYAAGANTAIRRNDASFNSLGIIVNGAGSTVDANSVWGNREGGIVLQSTSNTISNNVACGNTNADINAKVVPQVGSNTNKCQENRCYPSDAAMCNAGGGCLQTC